MGVVLSGGRRAFQAMAYGVPHQGTIDFVQNQFIGPTDGMSAAAIAFRESAQSILNNNIALMNSEATRAAVRKASSAWGHNVINELTGLESLQVAVPIMQRYIMAEPMARTMFHQQQLDGYSHSYVDLEPGKVGDDHYDYRRATNGMLREDGSFTVWFEELREGERELMFDEQLCIERTWDRLRHYITDHRRDPTSIYNATLS